MSMKGYLDKRSDDPSLPMNKKVSAEVNGRMMSAHPTPGPWDYIPSTEHHGPYVTSQFGSTICDFYVMSKPTERSTASGGQSRPIHHMHEMADANARLAAAAPDLLEALQIVASQITTIDNIANEEACAAVRAAIAKATGA